MTQDSPTNYEDEILKLQARLAELSEEKERSTDKQRKNVQRINMLEAVLETVPVGVVMADETGQIIHGNSQVVEMLRHPVYNSADVNEYEQWVSYHADGTRVKNHEYPLSQVIVGNLERAELDVHYQRGDGTRFWMRIIGKMVVDAEGNKIGATVALLDIDKQVRLTETQNLLIKELDHRVKNAFSVVKSIVSQTLRRENVPDQMRETLDERLNAYAAAHARLVNMTWEKALLSDVAEETAGRIGADRVTTSGPLVLLPSREALAASMAFYELGTNAVKYGSLSVPGGKVDLSWEVTGEGPDRILAIDWKESGGPQPQAPTRKGFGSFVIDRALSAETKGRVRMDYNKSGFCWNLTMPLPVTSKT